MAIDLYIGTEKLDLFKDENISLNSSIADVSDITKNTTDFTKGFTVPASDNNNNLFKHYYDANIDGGFDARIKQSGHIDIDGMPFKLGKFRLNGVKMKNGQPDSYNINFWGNLVSLKESIKNDELSSLPLTAYDHDYNSANVKQGLESNVLSTDMVYSLFPKKQYYYNSDPTDNVQTALLANIAYGGGSATGIVWNDLKPSIPLISVIEAIESKYTIANGYSQNIVFSRDFFGRTEFTDLYLWLNNTADVSAGGDAQVIDWDGGSSTYIDFGTNVGTYPPIGTTWGYRLDITPDSGYEDIPYTTRMYVNGENISEKEHPNGGTDWMRSRYKDNDASFTAYWEVQSSQEFKYTAFVGQNGTNTTASSSTVESLFITSENIPKIKTIDFLKGLFNAFKLVVIPLEDESIYINTLNDYYAEGSVLNITEYVDSNTYTVDRGDILNEILFKFEDPSTILNEQFTTNTGISYGNEETYLYDDNNDLLDGESLDFTLPFEQIVYERLFDLVDNEASSVQYGAIIDKELSPSNPKAHVFYNINTSTGSKPIAFINDADTKVSLGSTINFPSHTNTVEDFDYSFLFGAEFSVWDGAITNNNLYTNYHKTYLDAIFNIKRRNFNYKGKNFPLNLLLQLSLNDVVQIKNDYYRVDSYDLNLITGDIDFKLINSFDTGIAGFSPSSNDITVDYLSQTSSIYVINLGNFTDTKIDTGDGTTWVTVTSSGGNIYFDFDLNPLETTRTMTVNIENDDTLQNFNVLLTQTGDPFEHSLNFSDSRNNQYIPLI